MGAKENYNYSISLVRLVATSLIVTCHIMQYLELELAWWFNAGVQIFLCMSGFLYGTRNEIKDDLKFYKKSFLKILTDYYVVVVSVILLFILFCPAQLSAGNAVKALLTYGTLNGGGHLWYIPYCLFCYLITPFLSRCFANRTVRHKVMLFGLISIFMIAVTETFLDYFKGAWIFCYLLGFFLGSISTNSKMYRNSSFLIITGAILLNSIQIIQDYVVKLELHGAVASLYPKLCDYAHVALGVALFLVLKSVFSKVFKNGYPNAIKKLCFYTDRYSYDIYLVHQFVILGPFSLMSFTGILGINIVLILAIIALSALLVNFISTHIRHKISDKLAFKK